MENEFTRNEMLLGESVRQLSLKKVAVFGVGGVGGYAVEALARMGVGAFTLVDADTVTITNLNRQIIALHSTLGRYKAEVMAERVADINPRARVEAVRLFYLPENADSLPLAGYDYVVDAVDTVAAKLEIILRCQEAGVPVLSAMGTGNKIHPGLLRIADVSATKVCPLARAVRRELRARGVERGVKVLYSEEPPRAEQAAGRVPASLLFVPAAAGLLMAREVVFDLLGGGMRPC